MQLSQVEENFFRKLSGTSEELFGEEMYNFRSRLKQRAARFAIGKNFAKGADVHRHDKSRAYGNASLCVKNPVKN